MKIYVASSWRNKEQPMLVEALRLLGYDVYDFRNPAPSNTGFHWSAIDAKWMNWTPEQFREGLTNSIATYGFLTDMDALRACDVCILLQPCGRSAHLEMGWAAGHGKKTVVLLRPGCEPELMLAMADHLCTSQAEVAKVLYDIQKGLQNEQG